VLEEAVISSQSGILPELAAEVILPENTVLALERKNYLPNQAKPAAGGSL